ncbi:hypothetical protein [Pseudomonas citronellolis]|uniref:hypothetical protein n=1 Tax=Pseudomonas citronellolis TaxID=53408 RepID=UPI0021BF2358|nr:hypothetical protein [Pseudomonas citronellolis]UXJ55048.1 hypothetical protein N5P21_12865 [Pseudomonas citronellolis]
MNGREVVTLIQQQLSEVKAQGINEVMIDNLQNYLQHLAENIQQQVPLDQVNIDFQKQANEFNNQSSQELFRSVINSGQSALRTSILVGGGSAAALLAFASSAWRSLRPEGLELLAMGVFLLAAGVLCSAIATGMNYVGQYCYHSSFNSDSKMADKIGDSANIISNVLVVVSYCLYGVACWKVYGMLGLFNVVKPLSM